MIYGNNDYTEFENELGYTFKDKKNLDIAFTHKSFANEYKLEKVPSYERYEFLGDSILEFLCSRELFRRYPDMPEGELTKLRASLVCEYTLSQISRSLNFGNYLYLSNGEEQTGGRERNSILCDLFESVLGAIYLDGGLKPATKYVNKFLLTDIKSKSIFYDAKSILQEYAQKNSLTLSYRLISETGPDHNKTYTVQAVLGGKDVATGVGHTIKSAEQIAAHTTILELNIGEQDRN